VISVALACVVLALLAVSPAIAAPAWLAPVNLSEEGQAAGRPQVAFDGQGNAVAVWNGNDGANEYLVQAAFRPAGGAWQTPVRLSLYGQEAREPSVAFDGQGNAVAVWEAYNGVTFVVEAAFRPVGGAWQAPVYLSPEEIPGTAHPQVAFDEQGDAIAVWNRGGPFGGDVQAAFRPVGRVWQTPVNISEMGEEPQVAFDRQGDALAVWKHYDGSNYIVQTAFKSAGGVWQPPVNASEAGETAEGPRVAFDGEGNATVVWRRWTDGIFSYRIVQAAFKPVDGAWQAPVNITGAANELDQPENAGEPGIAVDGQGNAIAVWAWEFGSPVIQAAFRPAGGAWQAPVNISEKGASSPQVAFNGQGDALAIWEDYDGGNYIVQSAFRPAGGAWQTPVALSDEAHGAYDTQIAVDGQGDAVAAWTGEDGIQGAGYVAAGPLLNGLSIPTTGIVGQPVSFSVAPFDVWSVLGETSWSFGDGASASGPSVTHAYARAGTYGVTLNSADMLGNATSASGKVTIAPAPPTSTPSTPAPTSALFTSVPPTISAVSQSASTWRESGRPPVGTTFSISLNEKATVSFSFTRDVSGRMVGHRCVAKTSKNIRDEVCTRTIIVGVLSFTGDSGANKDVFQGRLPHSKKLKPGRYTLVITATNAAGQYSRPKSLSFAIME
jgi:hypothetical protein